MKDERLRDSINWAYFNLIIGIILFFQMWSANVLAKLYWIK